MSKLNEKQFVCTSEFCTESYSESDNMRAEFCNRGPQNSRQNFSGASQSA